MYQTKNTAIMNSWDYYEALLKINENNYRLTLSDNGFGCWGGGSVLVNYRFIFQSQGARIM